MFKESVTDEKYRILIHILDNYNGESRPSEKTFQNMSKHSGLTKEEISFWYSEFFIKGK